MGCDLISRKREMSILVFRKLRPKINDRERSSTQLGAVSMSGLIIPIVPEWIVQMKRIRSLKFVKYNVSCDSAVSCIALRVERSTAPILHRTALTTTQARNGITWVSGPKGRGRGRGRGSKAKKRGKTDSGYKWPNARRLTQSTPDDRQELSNIFKSFSKWCGFFYFWYFVNNCVCLHSESVVSGIGAKYAHVDCLNRLCIKNYLRNPSGNAVKPKKCFWPSRNDCT